MSTYKDTRRGVGGRKRLVQIDPSLEIKRRPDETDAEWFTRYRRENMRIWRMHNREKEAAKRRERYANDPEFRAKEARRREERREEHKAYSRQHFERNREAKLAKLEAWRKANPEHTKALSKAWWGQNPHKRNAYSSLRRAQEMRATPAWADLKAIEAFYAEARRLTEETGIPHHVDHIIPLRGKTVCGLHVESNLRVIPAEENLRKRNRLDARLAEASA